MRRSEPNTPVHSSKGLLVVTMRVIVVTSGFHELGQGFVVASMSGKTGRLLNGTSRAVGTRWFFAIAKSLQPLLSTRRQRSQCLAVNG